MYTTLQPLITQSVSRRYSAKSTILFQGEVPRSACILISGTIKVFSISAQGNEQVVVYHTAGEFFPSSWIFSKAPSTLFFYEAVTDCQIAFVSREELISFIHDDPNRTAEVLNYFTTNYSASLIRINALEQPNARDKLIYTLYYLCQVYSVDTANKVHIPFTLTHQDIAALVGLTRETTAMEMNKLKRQKILSYENQKYTIYIDRLIEQIGEDSFKGIRISIET